MVRHVIRKGIPDHFIEHGDRNELLKDVGLDASSLADAVRKAREEIESYQLAANDV